MKTFKITEETMMEVFNYLLTRPYAEVEKIINGIRVTAQNEIIAPEAPEVQKEVKKK